MKATNTAAGDIAEQLIASEVAKQNIEWYSPSNPRGGTNNGQLLMAAMAYMRAVDMVAHNTLERSREALFDTCKAVFFPCDWTGFNDKGTDVDNLVVAAAYIQQEIKRRLMLGERERPDWIPIEDASKYMKAARCGAGRAHRSPRGRSS